MAKHRRYPAYDVWEEHANWDVHTRQIVGARKMPQVAHSYLLPAEALLLQAIVSVLVDDHRLEVLTFVVAHIDESLASPVGESQRKVGVPEKNSCIVSAWQVWKLRVTQSSVASLARSPLAIRGRC